MLYGARRGAATVIAMTIGTALILFFGAGRLALLVGPEHALELGVLPYLPGAVVKIALAAVLLPMGWTVLQRRSPRR